MMYNAAYHIVDTDTNSINISEQPDSCNELRNDNKKEFSQQQEEMVYNVAYCTSTDDSDKTKSGDRKEEYIYDYAVHHNPSIPKKLSPMNIYIL